MAILDNAQLGGRATHVEREQVADAGQLAVVRAGQGATGGPRLQQTERKATGGLDGRNATRRQHQEQLAADVHLVQTPDQLGQVVLYERLDIDVDDRGRGPLVLTDLGHDFGRQRDAHARGNLADDCTHQLLVGRIRVAVHEADCNGFDALVAQLGRQARHRALVWCARNGPVGVDALVDRQAQMTRHQRRGHLQKQVVQVVAVLAGDLVRVAEAGGGQQRRTGAFALDDGVGYQRRAMDDVPDLVGGGVGAQQRVLQDVGDGGGRITRCGQHLADGELARGIIDQDQVRERPADVDADAIGSCQLSAISFQPRMRRHGPWVDAGYATSTLSRYGIRCRLPLTADG